MRVLVAVLVILLVMLQFELWRQYAQINELRLQVDQQVDRNLLLRERNDALAAEVADLKSGLEAVEERARAELGLVRDGERFFLVVDPEDLPDGQTDALRELEALPDAVVPPPDAEDDASAADADGPDPDGPTPSGG